MTFLSLICSPVFSAHNEGQRLSKQAEFCWSRNVGSFLDFFSQIHSKVALRCSFYRFRCAPSSSIKTSPFSLCPAVSALDCPTCRLVKAWELLLCGTWKMPAGLGPRVRGRKWCHAVRCCPLLFVWQPPLYWRPPHRLGTNGPRTAHFVSSAAQICASLWFCVQPERTLEPDPPEIHPDNGQLTWGSPLDYAAHCPPMGGPSLGARGPEMGLFNKWGRENQIFIQSKWVGVNSKLCFITQMIYILIQLSVI